MASLRDFLTGIYQKIDTTSQAARFTQYDSSGTEVTPASATGQASTNTKLDTLHTDNTAEQTLIGAVNESAPATDTASSGLNGRLQRIAQRITSLIALFRVGQGTMAQSTAVVIASNQSNVPVTVSGLSQINLYDSVTAKQGYIDNFRNLKTSQPKRIFGSNFGSSIETTYTYATNLVGSGAVTATNGTGNLTTSTTANSSAQLFTKNKIRHLSGRNNQLRITARFADTGTTNNVREIGLYIDASNQFNFRLSGTTFSVVMKKAGVETVVTSGSFNGNGSGSGGTYTVDTNMHRFELLYNASRVKFIIDDVAIHTFIATTASLTSSMVGQGYLSNTNSGGSTTNVNMDVIALSAYVFGDSPNNPLFYNINAVAETRTLKGGGGTLQSISIGRAGGAGATLTLYDNTAGSGTIIAIFDMTKDAAIGNHVFGVDGMNFYNGLTYVSSGTWTNGSATIMWE